MKVTLRKVILADFFGIVASDFEGDEKFYFKTKFLFGKENKAHAKQIEDLRKSAMMACKQAFKGEAKKIMKKPSFFRGIRDGADDEHLTDEKMESWKDFMFIGAKAKGNKRPGYAVNKGGKLVVLTDDEEIDEHFYSGAIVNATVTIFPYTKAKGGYSFWLNNILKIKDGERTGGRSTAAQDFDEDMLYEAEDIEEVSSTQDDDFDEFGVDDDDDIAF